MKATGLAALRVAATVAAVTCTAASAHAQTVKFVGQEVQVHGSIQQGWVVSDNNNFLTMDTSQGSGEFTDAAVNASTQLTKKLRVGAQLYTRNVGQLGNGQVQMDWGYADYRVHRALGVRAGKMKTALGLFNDTQDMEFLHTWALLPQAVYPLDLRAVTIAHVGVDFYGDLGLGQAGNVQYTAYYGEIPDDKKGGYRYGLEDSGSVFLEGIKSSAFGGDVRWTAPVEGLMVGSSFFQGAASTKVKSGINTPLRGLTVDADIPQWRRNAVYADFQRGRLHSSGELRTETFEQQYNPIGVPVSVPSFPQSQKGYFVSAAWRLFEKVEVGSYYSDYIANTKADASADNNHIATTAVTGRFDLTSFWHVKVEGHFIDGYGDVKYARGFYSRSNTTGVEPQTKMLVVRTGINF